MNAPACPTMTVANQLATLCREGKNAEALETLYSDDIISVETCDMPNMPATMTGIDAIKGKNQWWSENHEVHGGDGNGPFPHGDRFILIFNFDVTPKCGPTAGQRMQMEEAGLYTVAEGKIVKEEFFYDMGNS